MSCMELVMHHLQGNLDLGNDATDNVRTNSAALAAAGS